MPTKTIVIWGRDDLLSSSMELFLSARDEWEVICIPLERDFEALLQTVNRANPDVVIIQLGNLADNSNLAAILLQGHSGLKVIGLSLENNLMEVYCKRNILVKSSADLISEVDAHPVKETGN